MNIISNKNSLFDQKQVDVLSWLRFPLIVGVIFAHCNLYDLVVHWENAAPQWPGWLIWIFKYLYIIVFPARVQLLFIISGYFFFRAEKERDKFFFINKYKRRIYSLLIPYIIWNTIAIALQYVRFGIIEDGDFTITDYLSGFWNSTISSNGMPADGPLWFVRNLMIVSLLSPVIYILINSKYAFITIIALSLGLIFNIDIHTTGLTLDTILFFSIGALIALKKYDFTSIPHYIGIITLILYFPIQLLVISINENTSFIHLLDFSCCIIKITAVLYTVSLLFRKNILKATPQLTKISFFLYAIHGIIIGPIIKTMYLAMGDTNICLLTIYITTPLIIYFVSYILHKLLAKYSPNILKLLAGSR